MRMRRAPQFYRNMKRYRQIISVLVTYGLDDLVERLNMGIYIETGKRIIRFKRGDKGTIKLTRARRLVLALEKLGPTFIKIGQFLSTRPDVIAPEFIEELRKLQDEVPSFGFDAVKSQIDLELGASMEDLFAEFVEEPIAAASIAQVHLARLKNGNRVVVKIQRPGIKETVNADIDILSGLASLAEKHIAESELYDPEGVVREFGRTINREMDFVREGHNMERFAINFSDDDVFYVPEVYWDLTSKRILTMEYIDGIKVSDFKDLEDAGLDRKVIAKRGADMFLKQVLVYGLFHGDPHPGNIFVLDDNIICLLDYGIVGRVDDQTKRQMIRLILSVVRKDVEGITKVFIKAGMVDATINRRRLRLDLLEFIERYYQIPLRRLDIGTIVNDLFEIIHEHRIKVPADWTLMAKALVLMEGTGRELDPDFDMIEHTKPFLKRLIRERLAPANLTKNLLRTLGRYQQLLISLPTDTSEIIDKVKTDRISIGFQHKGLENLISMLDKSTNRLSFSLIITGLIVGSSLIMQVDKGPLFMGFPVFGLLGYSVAAVLGLWLVINILRSRRL